VPSFGSAFDPGHTLFWNDKLWPPSVIEPWQARFASNSDSAAVTAGGAGVGFDP
jgi:hypothetical protein